MPFSEVNIRYKQTNPVKPLLATHFKQAEQSLQKAGGTGIDTAALCAHMGIRKERLNSILKGSEVTLTEAVRYAQFFGIEVTTLYKAPKARK